MEFRNYIQKAIDHFGTQAALAKEIGKGQTYISWLMVDAKKVNPSVAIEIDKKTQGAVTKEQLCPEIFGGSA